MFTLPEKPNLTSSFSGNVNMHMRKNYEYKALYSGNVNMHMRNNQDKNTKTLNYWFIHKMVIIFGFSTSKYIL